MKIAAMGAGGVGGYFGARLQQAGHDVTFFARGRHLQALRERGLTVESAHGNAQLKVRALEDPREAEVADVVLFAVKLWDTEAAAERLRPVMGERTVIIPFQNGVESVERLRRIFPEKAVMGGSAYIATRIKAPGVIEHSGQMARLQFGPLVSSQETSAEAFLEACKSAGHPGRNPAGHRQGDLGEVRLPGRRLERDGGGARAVGRGAQRPRHALAFRAGDARDVAPGPRARHRARRRTTSSSAWRSPTRLHVDMKASLAHDLENGGRLEAPWLCGAVARMARESGMEAPVNRSVYAALKPYIDGQ